jgi:hypothetical protein
MGEAVALLTATLSIGGFQSAGFASNHQVGVDYCAHRVLMCLRVICAQPCLVGHYGS